MFDLLPWRPRKRSVEYFFGKVALLIESIDITSVQAEALVSSDDNHLTMGGGVSRAILEQAGPKVQQQARHQAPVRMGDVVVTIGGNLRAKHIFHCAVIDVDRRLKPILPNPARSRR
jgi:O-acetyl-ADP-ribose deacetylase (regulator of RNase III)